MTDDLRNLVNNLIGQKAEGEMLDYKADLELHNERQKYDLAKDLAAFANTKGGHILVGVEDKTWTPIGIDPGSIDKTKIFQIADSRISPSVSVDVDFAKILDLDFLLLSINCTGKVHELQPGRVPIRKGNITSYALVEEIFELKLKEIRNSKNQFHKLTIEPTSESEIVKLPEQQTKLVKKILERQSKKKARKRTFSWISKTNEEGEFLAKVRYDKFCRAFQGACEIELDKEVLDIDRKMLDLISFRVYGLLAALAVSRITQQQSYDFENMNPLQLTIRLSPSKMLNYIQEEDWEERNAFFKWAKSFRNYTEDPYDRELLEVIRSKSLHEIMSWMDGKYEHLNSGLIQGIRLLTLNTQMNNSRTKLADSDKTWIWSLVLPLLRDSSSSLLKAMSRL